MFLGVESPTALNFPLAEIRTLSQPVKLVATISIAADATWGGSIKKGRSIDPQFRFILTIGSPEGIFGSPAIIVCLNRGNLIQISKHYSPDYGKPAQFQRQTRTPKP